MTIALLYILLYAYSYGCVCHATANNFLTNQPFDRASCHATDDATSHECALWLWEVRRQLTFFWWCMYMRRRACCRSRQDDDYIWKC